MEFDYKLKEQKVVPHVKLPSSRGDVVDSWDFKQVKNLVIVFYHGHGCEVCKKKLEEYNKVYPQMKDFRFSGEILAISYDSMDQIKKYLQSASIDFPLLSDTEKKVTEKFTYEDNSRKAPFPSIFITDEYGALWHQKIVKEADQLPSGKEILDWSFSINCEC